MSFNFDEIIDRSGTGSVKYKKIKRGGEMSTTDDAHHSNGDKRLLQMWVADMDFAVAKPIRDALHNKVDERVFGYFTPEDSYFDSVVSWCGRRYNWEIDKEWIKVAPGIVPALYLMLPKLTTPGDKIIVQRPIYPPFVSSAEAAGCEVISNDLIYDRENLTYKMDFDDLAKKAADPDCKVAVLCSPHNPVGRVWTAEELTRFAEICIANDVIIVSDEIHCDLIYPGQKYVAMASLSEKIADHTITCIAPSKTFNLAGLKSSQIIISNPDLRQLFTDALAGVGMYGSNGFGPIATEAAYNHGEEWLDAVMEYVQANYEIARDYFAEHIPAIKVVKPEGTYLLWVDCGDLGFSQEELINKLIDEAHIHFNDGITFGPVLGKGFLRINIACSKLVLQEALGRMKELFAA
ncbi:MAG: cystathionine beta-lyase [Candidatus Promineifilaceae bacterium]|jgi:cystathionine beta-lyase